MKHDKQHLPHAASLKRMAKELRIRGRNIGKLSPVIRDTLNQVAHTMDNEAKVIRAMR